ncbi:MAG: serine hydrolase [Ignavibacteriae bacterium]|nr:serine hydrolase [Ignavibacteriota bacterium]
MKEKFFLTIIIFISIWGCSTENDDNNSFLQYSWEFADPIDLNIDKHKIDEAFSHAEKLDFIYSIIVVRNGKIAAEKYFNGKDKYSIYSIKSVSKSFLSAALGIAESKGMISLNERLTDIIDNYQSQITDTKFNEITLQNLITMKAGLDGDRNIYSNVVNSSNWLSTIFSMNLINNPGVKFVYTTPGTHLLSAVLTASSGVSSLEFIEEHLTNKMGIEINDWRQDPQGIYFGGNDMFFTTRNMAVLGLLYLNEGKLNEIQIVPKDWITASLNDYSGGIGNWSVMKNIGYGYLWWLGEINEYKMYTAIGHGGQFVLCIPKLNLIVATNAFSDLWWDEANEQETTILNIIGNYIIPAVNP